MSLSNSGLSEFEWDGLKNMLEMVASPENEARRGAFRGRSEDATFTGTHDGRFVDVDQRLSDLLGYKIEELVTRDIRSLCVSHRDFDGLLQEVEKRGYVINRRMRFLRSDGTELSCCITATVRPNNGEGDHGLVLNFKSWVKKEAAPR
jgi:PAS domain S-box-containing protein